MKFNIIGAGRLGTCLALSLLKHKGNKLLAVCNSELSSSKKSVNSIGTGEAIANVRLLPASDITFITTPDDMLVSVAADFSENKSVRGSIVVHCSGVHSSTILQPLKLQGCNIASIHPFKAFAKGLEHADAFADCDCVVEGDDKAVVVLKKLFSDIGAHIVMIGAKKKSAYHAASVIASNYLVTLAESAANMLVDSGILRQDAKRMTERIMQANLNNIAESDYINQALTGPIARGDIDTIKRHLQAITNLEIKNLYQSAGLAALAMTKHNDDTLSKLRLILSEVQ